MITHGQALLQAVLDAPADDAPRLIYADWCEEYGQPERAEFIRVQITEQDMYTLGGSIWLTEQNGKATGLMQKYGPLWLGVPAEVVNGFCYIYRRGFVDYVECTCADWLNHGPAIVRQHPIERVESNREPHAHGTRYCWYQFRFEHFDQGEENQSRYQHWVPLQFGAFLQANERHGDHHVYADAEAAKEDLSQAMLAWAMQAEVVIPVW